MKGSLTATTSVARLCLLALIIGITTLPQSYGFVPNAPHRHRQQHSPSSLSSSSFNNNNNINNAMPSATQLASGGPPEIEVISQPDENFLKEKGVFRWGTWGCDVSKFPWTYDSNESCYLLKGQVTVTPTDGRKPATFGKGDFVTFPAGMSCTWDVSEAVHKHFKFF